MPSPNLRVVCSPESEEDLLSMWRWGAARFSAKIADHHLRDIQRAVDTLAASPMIGRTREDLRPSIREIIVYPTVLFYRLADEGVEIVRAVDGRRDLAAIFSGD